jgi:predicted transcriptional regulator
MQDGSRERYDPITLPSEVYLDKSVVSKTLAKLEADGILQKKQGNHII